MSPNKIVLLILLSLFTSNTLQFSNKHRTRSDNKLKEDIKNVPNITLPNDFALWKPKNFNINCSKVIDDDRSYIDEIKNNRFKMEVIPETYKYDCESIKSRGFYPKVPLSEIEANYPIAYARNVYNNFNLLELQFLLSYAPQNHYCFAVDSKSTELFKQLTTLSKCFNNVYVSPKRFNMTSGGIYQSLSTYECMKILSTKKWKYFFMLQNDDFPLKTNREIVEILTARNSTLDMDFIGPDPPLKDRVNWNDSWDYKSLNFFNEKDIRKYDQNLLSKNIIFQKGCYASGIPRQSVNYILNNINVTKFLNQTNTVNIYGEDEIVWQTLFSDDVLKIPQYVERNCLNTLYNDTFYGVRTTIWLDRECKTNMRHHKICIYGIEMLDEILNMKTFFGYRFIPKYDFGAALCFTEYLFNKTYLKKFDKIDTSFHRNLPSTKYQNADPQTKDEIIKTCILNNELKNNLTNNLTNNLKNTADGSKILISTLLLMPLLFYYFI